MTAETATQRRKTTSGKTQELPDPEATHSAQSLAAERFGTEASKPAHSAYAPSHRARKIQCLREELRLLKTQYKSLGEVERAGLADLRAILRKQLLTLRRAEFHRRRQKERARKRAAFFANPFKLTKQLLGQRGLAASPAPRMP